MRLFQIDTTDLTSNITVPSYKVNSSPVSETWTDANGIEHRDIYRTRVSGSFTIKFFNHEDYYNFLTLLNSNTGAGGYTPCSCYVNNLNTVVNINAFIDITPPNNLPYYGIKNYDGFEVKLTER